MFRYRLRTLLQFRLATLLLLITLFGIWLGVQVNSANRQKRAIAAIEAARGLIQFDYQRDANGQRIPDAEPPGPRWLRKLIGDDYFRKVKTVDFSTGFYQNERATWKSRINDEGLRVFQSLPSVEYIDVSHNLAVTDEGLAHLRNLKHLRSLGLYECNITGAGFPHLASLPNLKGLSLGRTPLTEGGIVRLGELQGLESLGLMGTPITDDDLPALATLARLKSLQLDETGITDRGLIHLQKMPGLESLILPTGISDEGFQQLKQALPHCQIGPSNR